jgi:protocatechuate 3,4-dioxygenase beta subunit
MTLVFPRDSLNAFPKHLTPGYRSTVKRSPSKPLILVPQTLSELTGPVYGHDAVQEGDNDLTKQHKGEPLGERIIVHGHVYDEDKRPVPDTLVEIWQANACGRYVHNVDQHPAPLDPNFHRRGARGDRQEGLLPFRHGEARRVSRGAITTMRGGRTTSTSLCSGTRSCRAS